MHRARSRWAAAGCSTAAGPPPTGASARELARRYPAVTVDPGVLFVDEGDILTSAGSAASIDLCLHVVRQDYGTEIATQLARQLVVPPQRDGGQAQYIDAPLPELDGASLFAGTVAWLQEHLDQPITVEDLAARSAMSPRTFARRFVASTGTTPYRWLLRQRIQLAQRLLETTDLPIDPVARASGFSPRPTCASTSAGSCAPAPRPTAAPSPPPAPLANSGSFRAAREPRPPMRPLPVPSS